MDKSTSYGLHAERTFIKVCEDTTSFGLGLGLGLVMLKSIDSNKARYFSLDHNV